MDYVVPQCCAGTHNEECNGLLEANGTRTGRSRSGGENRSEYVRGQKEVGLRRGTNRGRGFTELTPARYSYVPDKREVNIIDGRVQTIGSDRLGSGSDQRVPHQTSP